MLRILLSFIVSEVYSKVGGVGIGGDGVALNVGGGNDMYVVPVVVEILVVAVVVVLEILYAMQLK
jgi:hypothetical protein